MSNMTQFKTYKVHSISGNYKLVDFGYSSKVELNSLMMDEVELLKWFELILLFEFVVLIRGFTVIVRATF